MTLPADLEQEVGAQPVIGEDQLLELSWEDVDAPMISMSSVLAAIRLMRRIVLAVPGCSEQMSRVR